MAEERSDGVRIVRPRWGEAVLVCGKCLKRHQDGKGLKRALKAELKDRAAVRPTRRKPRLIRIACVGLCPRRAIVVASAATLAAGEIMLVKDAADVATAVGRLRPGAGADSDIDVSRQRDADAAAPGDARERASCAG